MNKVENNNQTGEKRVGVWFVPLPIMREYRGSSRMNTMKSLHLLFPQSSDRNYCHLLKENQDAHMQCNLFDLLQKIGYKKQWSFACR